MPIRFNLLVLWYLQRAWWWANNGRPMPNFAHLHHAPLVRQKSSATVSVLVADDHPVVLHGLAHILRLLTLRL